MTITLATLPHATAQEVFDQAATHLLKQNKKARTEQGSCQYHMPDGRKCVGGCFIDDDEYSENMEGNGWGTLLKFDIVPTAHAGLMVSLQEVHDLYSPVEWRTQLRHVAKHFGLSAKVLNA